MSISEYLFFIGIIAIQSLPINIPIISVSTHVVVRILFVLLLFTTYFFGKKNTKIYFSKILEKRKNIILIGSLFFLFQSFSVVNAIDIPGFLNRYKDIFFYYILPFIILKFLSYRNFSKKVVLFLLSGFLINLFFQLIIFYLPNIFLKYGPTVIGKNAFDVIAFDIQRSRINFESYDETIVPIAVFFFLKTKNIFFLIFILITIIFSLISGYRIRLLVLVFSIILSTILAFNYKKITTSLFVVITFIITLAFMSNLQFLTINRVVFPAQEEFLSINYRVKRWNDSLSFGLANKITGVGLGNFYLYLPNKDKLSSSTNSLAKDSSTSTNQDPHNIFFLIFAESGLLALISYLILILYFIWKDYIYYISKSTKSLDLTKFFIISFWSLFIISQITPTSTIKYAFYFWLYRLIIEEGEDGEVLNLNS